MCRRISFADHRDAKLKGLVDGITSATRRRRAHMRKGQMIT